MAKKDIEKKKIHFILPGGGVNGAFQAGFLYRLLKDCKEYIDVVRIDGISVGALNGLGILLESPELLKNIWFSIENRQDIFNSHSSRRETFRQGCLYDSNGLREIIYNYKQFVDPELLSIYNCVVHNSSLGIYEYINGDHPDIFDFVVASASPPIISPKSKIGDYLYTDGGVDQVYPADYIDSTADIHLVVGYYEEKRYYLFKLYKKLKKSIEQNMNYCRSLVEDNKIFPVYNPCRFNILDFRPQVIDNAFQLGEEKAVQFYMEKIIV